MKALYFKMTSLGHGHKDSTKNKNIKTKSSITKSECTRLLETLNVRNAEEIAQSINIYDTKLQRLRPTDLVRVVKAKLEKTLRKKQFYVDNQDALTGQEVVDFEINTDSKSNAECLIPKNIHNQDHPSFKLIESRAHHDSTSSSVSTNVVCNTTDLCEQVRIAYKRMSNLQKFGSHIKSNSSTIGLDEDDMECFVRDYETCREQFVFKKNKLFEHMAYLNDSLKKKKELLQNILSCYHVDKKYVSPLHETEYLSTFYDDGVDSNLATNLKVSIQKHHRAIQSVQKVLDLF